MALRPQLRLPQWLLAWRSLPAGLSAHGERGAHITRAHWIQRFLDWQGSPRKASDFRSLACRYYKGRLSLVGRRTCYHGSAKPSAERGLCLDPQRANQDPLGIPAFRSDKHRPAGQWRATALRRSARPSRTQMLAGFPSLLRRPRTRTCIDIPA